MSGDVKGGLQALKKLGTIDAYFDVSPPEAEKGKELHLAAEK